jgi:hypothetical protein
MYGFSGYATNSYATRRPFTAIRAAAVKLGMIVLQSLYGVGEVLVLRFRNLTLSSPESNDTTALMLGFRRTTLSNPETNDTTLEL